MIHDISGNKDKDTDELLIKTLKSDMNIDMKIEQIDRTHRIESFKKDSGNRCDMPMDVTFLSIKKFQKVRRYRSLKVLPK